MASDPLSIPNNHELQATILPFWAAQDQEAIKV